MSGRWAGRGHEHQQLGKSGWQRQDDNRRTMRLHGGTCHVCRQPGSDDIDHVIPLAEGGTDTEANRRPIHSIPCHRDKTQAEAERGRARRSRRRPAEGPHPGRLGGGG